MKADIEIVWSEFWRNCHFKWGELKHENNNCMFEQFIAIILGYADPVELK